MRAIKLQRGKRIAKRETSKRRTGRKLGIHRTGARGRTRKTYEQVN